MGKYWEGWDYGGPWRKTTPGRWIVCDPSLDHAVAALPVELRAKIRANTPPEKPTRGMDNNGGLT